MSSERTGASASSSGCSRRATTAARRRPSTSSLATADRRLRDELEALQWACGVPKDARVVALLDAREFPLEVRTTSARGDFPCGVALTRVRAARARVPARGRR